MLVAIASSLLIFLGVLVSPVLAAESTVDTCERFDSMWSQKQAAYGRAREVRKKAFENTEIRWLKLFDRLDGKSVSTVVVRADVDNVVNKFTVLVGADDDLMTTMRNLERVSCSNSTGSEARKAMKVARESRRNARQEYVKSLRLLATDLAKIKTSK